MKYTGLVNKKAVAVLQPGEAAVFAVLVKPRGVVGKAFLSGLLSGVGDVVPAGAVSAAAEAAAERAGKTSVSAPAGSHAGRFPAAEDVIMAVTDRRTLVFRQTFGIMSPNLELASAYAPDQLVTLRIGGGTATKKLFLVFSDDSGVRMDVPRGQGDLGNLVDAFNALRR
ncbi:hypothetical protein [Embleya hyalina]|uniref:hypothetical protein n=1 Tax=Embleya hyalina TaxID=516124 RepID=UPI000F84CC0F|nr:hypothetical protein [Embleya hyalina]